MWPSPCWRRIAMPRFGCGKRVRGLRGIERSVRSRQACAAITGLHIGTDRDQATSEGAGPAAARGSRTDPAGDVVLDYCTAVRGILNKDQGGPLRSARITEWQALSDEVRESIQRNWDAKKGDAPNSNSAAWPTASTGYRSRSRPSKRRSENTSRTSRRSRRPSNLERRVESGSPGDVPGVDRPLRADGRSDSASTWPA